MQDYKEIDEDPDTLKLLGNNYMTDKQYLKAADKYTKAITKLGDKPLLLSNRAEAYLKLGYFNAALEDSNESLKISTSNQIKQKTLFRKGRALEQLATTKEELLKVKEIYDQLESTINISSLEEKLRNVEGKYNKEELIKYETDCINLIKAKKYYLDSLNKESKFTSFKSNKIKLDYNEEKGVFWKAIQPINQGELIIAELPIVSVYTTEIEKFSSTFKEFQKYGFTHNDIALQILFTFLNDKMKLDSEKKYIIEKISKLSSLKTCKLTIEERMKNFECTDEIIKGILSNNSMQTVRTDIGKIEPVELVFGLFYNSSFFNHSCFPNCFYFGIANFLFIKAIKNIKEDEELTISYIDPKPLPIRKQEILKWEFCCKCELCLNEIDECENDIYFDGYKAYNTVQTIMKNEEIYDIKNLSEKLSVAGLDSLIVTIDNFMEKYIKGEYIEDIINQKLKFFFYEVFKGFAIILAVIDDKYKNYADYLFDIAFRLIRNISIRERFDIINLWLSCCKKNMFRLKVKELEMIMMEDYKKLFDI